MSENGFFNFNLSFGALFGQGKLFSSAPTSYNANLLSLSDQIRMELNVNGGQAMKLQGVIQPGSTENSISIKTDLGLVHIQPQAQTKLPATLTQAGTLITVDIPATPTGLGNSATSLPHIVITPAQPQKTSGAQNQTTRPATTGATPLNIEIGAKDSPRINNQQALQSALSSSAKTLQSASAQSLHFAPELPTKGSNVFLTPAPTAQHTSQNTSQNAAQNTTPQTVSGTLKTNVQDIVFKGINTAQNASPSSLTSINRAHLTQATSITINSLNNTAPTPILSTNFTSAPPINNSSAANPALQTSALFNSGDGLTAPLPKSPPAQPITSGLAHTGAQQVLALRIENALPPLVTFNAGAGSSLETATPSANTPSINTPSRAGQYQGVVTGFSSQSTTALPAQSASSLPIISLTKVDTALHTSTNTPSAVQFLLHGVNTTHALPDIAIGTRIIFSPQSAAQGSANAQSIEQALISQGIMSEDGMLNPLFSATKATQAQAAAQSSSSNIWALFQEIQSALQASNTQAATGMSNLTPSPQNPQALGPAMLFFIAAARGGDLNSWLGDKAIESLSKSDIQLLSRLSTESANLSQTANEPAGGEWRSTVLPMAWDGQTQKMALYYKHDSEQDEQDEETSKKAGGRSTRFVFDFSLDQVGHLQIDGLFRPNAQDGKRLDMIVRTEQLFGEAARAHMRRIYASALKQSKITGALDFQGPQGNWLQIDKLKAQDVGINA